MIAQTGLMLADGRYKLVSRIAVGGMGEVWRAHDLAADTPVAIKVLRQEFTGDQTSLKRLRIEARNASILNHPNITTVHDYREHEGTGYLVMEYVDGQSLADVLAAHSIIAPMRLLPILIQSALGLHAAHSAGVVHRDVKPGNILLGPSDHVKLTDFGISVAHGQLALTDTGKVMGTAQYLAPEQALGNPATPAGDLYSLGVIAYEALAGRRPFRGANYVAIALSQVNDVPPPLPSTVERSLAALVMQLLDKSPQGRPADGAELARLFGEALETHRHLAGRLLASRSGDGAIPGPRPRAERAAGPRGTAEQPVLPASSLMPPPAPATDVGPVVGDPARPADHEPAPAQTAPTAAASPADAASSAAGGFADPASPGRQAEPAAAPSGRQAEPPTIPAGASAQPAPTADAGPADAAPSAAGGFADPALAALPAEPGLAGGEAAGGTASGAKSGGPAEPNQEDGLASPTDFDEAAGPGRALPADPAETAETAAQGPERTGQPGARPRPRRGPDAPPPTSPLSQAAPKLPLPSAADLARPLGQPAPPPTAQPGAAADGTFEPAGEAAASPGDRAKPGRPSRVRDWLWAILAGAGLLIILLIGLLTVITANAETVAPVWLTQTRAAPATQGGVSIVSTVPGLGPIMER